jgi:hypothetical protein
MTVQELVDYCNENGISLDTHIAMNAKDDYMLTKDSISLGRPYFGNCSDGSEFEKNHYPRDEHGDIDYDSEDVPKFLVLYTGVG